MKAEKVPGTAKMIDVWKAVVRERQAQDQRFGKQNYDAAHWLPILAKEFGEVSKEVCDCTFPSSEVAEVMAIGKLQNELIQVAAVAIAWAESIQRSQGIDASEVSLAQLIYELGREAGRHESGSPKDARK